MFERVLIYKNNTIIPPKKIKTSALKTHRERDWCRITLNATDRKIKATHNIRGWVIKTLVSKKKKKAEIIGL